MLFFLMDLETKRAMASISDEDAEWSSYDKTFADILNILYAPDISPLSPHAVRDVARNVAKIMGFRLLKKGEKIIWKDEVITEGGTK